MVLLQAPASEDAPEVHRFSDDLEHDSACSTPYVSAPSSPGRCGGGGGYFFSAPASPMHFLLSSASRPPSSEPDPDFEFSSRFSSDGSLVLGSMTSADELFFNGQIRPVKLSSLLQRPQVLPPLLDLENVNREEEEFEKQEEEEEESRVTRGRDLKLKTTRSLHRKARSLSPLRSREFQWSNIEAKREDVTELEQSERPSTETTPSCSASSSRSGSSGRNSNKWIFLKDLLYRSKSEGRGNGKDKFWSSISLISPSKPAKQKQKQKDNNDKQPNERRQASCKTTAKPLNGIDKRRRMPPSAHELHYTANRAHAEEMKKRTYLPYRHGLFGCLGFSSKGYSALNGLAKSLNPVSSR
ncbi:hypothetical protein K2173_025472 [Erythroxylum novogranatense]|uniref:Uncharacterized protein n=1 Tax=Erythroxylum novogranatense TaxID=1862640 RepID=A0AAV8SB78_9ROSI|nr:hypothetical protein K2173_025472 [Erythroxylum novogranatense]